MGCGQAVVLRRAFIIKRDDARTVMTPSSTLRAGGGWRVGIDRTRLLMSDAEVEADAQYHEQREQQEPERPSAPKVHDDASVVRASTANAAATSRKSVTSSA